MHTQVPRKTRRSAHRLAIAGAGLLATAGLGVFAIGGASGALAQTPGTVTGGSGANNNQVTATVTVPEVTTLTLNSNTIPFPAPTTLPGTVTSTLTGTASTNDAAGYTVAVASVGQTLDNGQSSTGASADDFLGASTQGHIPITDLSETGSGLPTVIFAEGGESFGTDATAAPGANPISDAYSLNVPATAGADTYSAVLAYTIAGN